MRFGALVVGDTVRLCQTFRDFDGTEHRAGTVLTLIGREYFPYDGGHTFRFDGGTVVRLAETVQGDARVLHDEDVLERA